jgi:hypothetical protein
VLGEDRGRVASEYKAHHITQHPCMPDEAIYIPKFRHQKNLAFDFELAKDA